MNILDTIAAISTPYGKGGIAVLRVSGENALTVADKVFSAKSGKRIADIPSTKAIYGYIFESVGEKRRQIDDGIAVFFRAPNSFTGEDTVEISCHGGILITQKVLTALLSAGARLALPGEFTKRAFINGKMSLTSAEALGDLLEAKTDEQIGLARSGMRGTLSGKIGEIYSSLGDVLAAIFAHIDYPDEDLADVSHDEMLAVAKENLIKLKTLEKTYSTGKAVVEGIPTVILGKTNAGKSSLYNRILGRDAAIVTEIEGTTRDILTESAKIGRVLLKLSDTAGLRESSDMVESIGIERARRTATEAELILAVFDGSREPDSQDAEILKFINSLNGVKVAIINKSDLGTLPYFEKLKEEFEFSITLSAGSGEGFDMLTEKIEEIYIDKNLDTASDAIISNARQHAAIISAIKSLSIAISAIENTLPLEICCAEVENTLASLGELDGRTVSEDIVAKIFSNFCVGK